MLYLEFHKKNLSDFSEEYGEKFYQNTAIMEKRYQNATGTVQ